VICGRVATERRGALLLHILLGPDAHGIPCVPSRLDPSTGEPTVDRPRHITVGLGVEKLTQAISIVLSGHGVAAVQRIDLDPAIVQDEKDPPISAVLC